MLLDAPHTPETSLGDPAPAPQRAKLLPVLLLVLVFLGETAAADVAADHSEFKAAAAAAARRRRSHSRQAEEGRGRSSSGS